MTLSVDERQECFDGFGAPFAGSAEFATAIVEGEPGLGKSTMLDEAARKARRERFLVLQARCSELESPFDYAVERRLLDQARLDPTAPVRLGHPGDFGGAVPQVGETGSVSGLHSEVSRLAIGRPVVVVVDDLQWCDKPSAAALVYLARRSMPGRILLLAATSPHSARQCRSVSSGRSANTP